MTSSLLTLPHPIDLPSPLPPSVTATPFGYNHPGHKGCHQGGKGGWVDEEAITCPQPITLYTNLCSALPLYDHLEGFTFFALLS
eukprot:692974-Hanusia_phi.AAC.1